MKLFRLAFISFLFFASGICFAKEEINFGKVSDFALINQKGENVRLTNLKGKIWIADFIFTRCQSQCPLMSGHMRELQSKLLNSEVLLVSFTVDPEHDRPEILSEYAKRLGAQEGKWIFLTGEKKQIWDLAEIGFKLGVDTATPEDLKQGGEPILHSERFVLVDQVGNIRGFYDSTETLKLDELIRDAQALTKNQEKKHWIRTLPALNAGLNTTCAILIILGLILIRQGAWTGHALCMCFAMLISSLFLISYLYYHFHGGHVHFLHHGFIRIFYFVILISHTILAFLVPPLTIAALYQALRSRFDKHVRIAKIAFPIWLYVSVTGVIVYYMLYKM